MYAGWFCPFVQRAWTVLEEKKTPYQYIEVNPYHKPDSLLKLNPRGLVPTLQFENKPLYESTVICEFLDEQYPSHGPRLLPEDLYQHARARIWTDYVTSRVVPSFHRLLQFQADERADGERALQAQCDEYLGHIREFTREMDPAGPFFLGGEPALVDFAIAPWAVRHWVLDHFKGGLGVPAEGRGGADEAVWARWRRFVQAVEARPSVRDTTSEREYYLPIYQRYADDKAQSELAKATRAGRGVP